MSVKQSCVRGALLSMVVSCALLAPAAFAQPAAPQAEPPPAEPTATAAVPQTPPPPAEAPPPNYSNVKNEWHEGDPLPAGYHAEKEMYVPLVMAGAIELGTTWLTLGVLPGAILLAAGADSSGLSSCVACTSGGATLLVPAIGPFLAMIVLGAEGATEPAGYALLAVDGVIQSAGLGMLIAGLVMQRDILVKDRVAGIDVEVQPVVSAGPGGGTLGLSGSF